MVDYFRFLNLCVKNQRRVLKLFFVSLQVVNKYLINELLGRSIIRIAVERGRIVVVLG